MTAKKIVVLATGGTLAGTAASAGDNVGYTAAQLGIAQILERIEPLKATPLVTEQVAQVDSKDMSFAIWATLAVRCTHWISQPDVAGVVITHGTDTLEETAFFLHSVLDASKPVVLTCAMRPATALAADGPQNIVDAIAVAGTPGARGVVAVCAGTVHGAVDVAKSHVYRLDAFSSGDAGPIGVVEDGAVRVSRAWPESARNAPGVFEKVAQALPARWPRVEIVMSHAGANGLVVDALVAQGVQGIVVAATGNGTIHHEVETALVRAEAAGLLVVRSTRVASGRVIPHERDRFADSGGLSPVKARVAMMLKLLDAPR
ncbi:MAG: asparaginase [Pseudomonadota bacterium]